MKYEDNSENRFAEFFIHNYYIYKWEKYKPGNSIDLNSKTFQWIVSLHLRVLFLCWSTEAHAHCERPYFASRNI